VRSIVAGQRVGHGNGPLTGTGAPTGARYMVMTKSPLTGAITCSNAGGMFPTEFKRTGYDAIVFTGRSEAPVYLWLDHEKAELRPADQLWGEDTHRTTDYAACRDGCQGKGGLHRPGRRKAGPVRRHHE
jgi:aldehyde:ferredoxin oxidoreductase